MLTDKQLNDYVQHLLNIPKEKRAVSNGSWAKDFDCAMAMWVERYPDTRPPAMSKLAPPPPCFVGEIPPIYDGELE
jgi:hypothetical protein